MALVEAEGLAKRYRRTWALRGLDLSLADGAVTALVGPNGAGKSTFIKLCLGFERPTAGRVLVAAADPRRDRGAAIGHIGYVPQTPTLYRELSAEDHLRLAASLRAGFDTGYARRRLDDLGIPLTSRPGELSGGQAAQLWLAVALGTRAPILLLDEPLANLDPLARREFLAVVSDAARTDGVTVVLSSHVIWDVEPITNRLLLLADGEVLVHEDVAVTLAAHRAGMVDELVPIGERVSLFPDRDGRTRELRRVPPGVDGAGATLEEVVMGYLASRRPFRERPTPDAAPTEAIA
ncbi:MAG TPA: ABC transporter ATP-binding protein [Candidatus Limnocylindrales bacterium]